MTRMESSSKPGISATDVDYPPWGVKDCALGLGAAVVGLVVIVSLLSLILPRGTSDTRTVKELLVGLAATLLFELTLFSIAAGFTAGKYGGGLRVLGWRPRMPDAWIGWSVLAVVLAWITLGLYSAITAIPGLQWLRPQSNVPSGLFDHKATVALAAVLTVVAAPLIEETFFRGFLFNGLRRTLGFSGAATVSGVLFALAHTSPGLIIPFTVIGVIFAYVYRRTGTIWTNVSAHFLFNLVSVLFTLIK
ncbi:MAG: CPBP family intramembrane glutamic endopeptidase [Dehalococcoidia bacterium]